MREVKFRVWFPPEHGDKGIMRDVKSIDFIFGRVADMSDHGKYIDKDNLVLMQYTGLKDINDVEIYEGDIVKETLKFEHGKKREIFHEVIFDNGMFKYSQPLVYGHKLLEVVGNIKENPELLEN